MWFMVPMSFTNSYTSSQGIIEYNKKLEQAICVLESSQYCSKCRSKVLQIQHYLPLAANSDTRHKQKRVKTLRDLIIHFTKENYLLIQ